MAKKLQEVQSRSSTSTLSPVPDRLIRSRSSCKASLEDGPSSSRCPFVVMTSLLAKLQVLLKLAVMLKDLQPRKGSTSAVFSLVTEKAVSSIKLMK